MCDGFYSDKKYYCRNCLNYFYKKEKLNYHEDFCYNKENTSTDIYPEKG